MEKQRNPKVYGDVITINVDVQNDFALPTGALSVTDGEAVIEPLNHINHWTRENGGQVVFTRDWHPEDTAHFNTHGGPWPPHCMQYRAGAAFHDDLVMKENDNIGSKGTSKTDDGYSGWGATFADGNFSFEDMNPRYGWSYHTIPGALESSEGYKLRYTDQEPRVAVLVGGLATDYCVKATVLDALKERAVQILDEPDLDGKRTKLGAKLVDVYLLVDAIRAVNIQPTDEQDAIYEMVTAGAVLTTTDKIINGELAIDRNLLERYPWKS